MAISGVTSSASSRIVGIGSGMDIDSMVSKLMTAAKAQGDKNVQRMQQLEWRRDDYREMNTALTDLDNTIFDGISKQGNVMKTAVTSSNTGVVTATASADTAKVSNAISVSHVASSARWVSDGAIDDAYNFTDGTNLTFQVTNGDGTPVKDANGVVKNITIALSSTDTIDSVLKKLSDNQDLGITAFRDKTSLTDKVVITKDDTGKLASLNVMDATTAGIMNKLGFTSAASGLELGNGGVVKIDGSDASFSINGYSTTRSSNDFTISGVSYSLKNVGDANVSVTTDVNSIYDTISKFVDKYNEVIGKVNGKLSEDVNRDFKPLTDAQRAAMTETQITSWEKKAHSGMLKNEANLSRGLSQMRLDLYQKVDGINSSSSGTRPDQLTSIGIQTSSNFDDKGKLVITDPQKLKDAIANDPQAVYQIFMGTGGDVNSATSTGPTDMNSTNYKTSGLVQRLRKTISSTLKATVETAGKTGYTNSMFTIGKDLTRISDDILAFNTKMSALETLRLITINSTQWIKPCRRLIHRRLLLPVILLRRGKGQQLNRNKIVKRVDQNLLFLYGIFNFYIKGG